MTVNRIWIDSKILRFWKLKSTIKNIILDLYSLFHTSPLFYNFIQIKDLNVHLFYHPPPLPWVPSPIPFLPYPPTQRLGPWIGRWVFVGGGVVQTPRAATPIRWSKLPSATWQPHEGHVSRSLREPKHPGFCHPVSWARTPPSPLPLLSPLHRLVMFPRSSVSRIATSNGGVKPQNGTNCSFPKLPRRRRRLLSLSLSTYIIIIIINGSLYFYFILFYFSDEESVQWFGSSLP